MSKEIRLKSPKLTLAYVSTRAGSNQEVQEFAAFNIVTVPDSDLGCQCSPHFPVSGHLQYIYSRPSRESAHFIIQTFILCLPLAIFPSNFPVVAKCSRPSILMACPNNFICLRVMAFIKDLLVSAFSRTSLFVSLWTHGT